MFLVSLITNIFCFSCRTDIRDRETDGEEEEEILGSDDEEQEDPRDYCKGCLFRHLKAIYSLH